MPLIVMCGVPGSGKTKRASDVAEYLTQKHHQKVHIVNEQQLGIDKKTAFSNSQMQKIARGRLKTEVEKRLVGNAIVIADSNNYIKGYRYQMHCIARQQKTTYCVVFCNTSLDRCKHFNELNEGNNFPVELLEDLAKRMEVPQLKNRWDVPLFERRQEEETPLEEIADTLLFQQKKSKDPVSTKQEEKLSEDYLSELDAIMQEINQDVLMGRIKLQRGWAAVELKKFKRDFVNIAKQRPQSLKVLKQAYLDYMAEADKRK